jgi:hypothetical protein
MALYLGLFGCGDMVKQTFSAFILPTTCGYSSLEIKSGFNGFVVLGL